MSRKTGSDPRKYHRNRIWPPAYISLLKKSQIEHYYTDLELWSENIETI